MEILVVIDSLVVVLYIVFGTLGNLLIIAAAVLRPKLRSPPNLFIVNVAVTDLLMASYGMSNIMVHVVNGSEHVDKSSCIATGMTIVISCGVSLLSLCFIAFNRYMSVCQYAHYSKIFTRRNLLLMIAGIWIFSLLLVLVSYFAGLCDYHYDPDQVTCTYDNEKHMCTYMFVLVGIVVPSSMATSFYVLIYKKLRDTSKRLDNHSNPSGQKKARKCKKQAKTIIMMFTAFALFVIVWFPYGIVMVVDSHVPQNGWMIKIVTWLAFSNCGINWIVYGAMNKNFREGYRDVIMGCRKHNGGSGSAGTDDSTPKPGEVSPPDGAPRNGAKMNGVYNHAPVGEVMVITSVSND